MYHLIATLLLILFLVITGTVVQSKAKTPKIGISADHLLPCPPSPNCVCSELPGLPSFVPPVKYSIAHDKAWNIAATVITSMNGTIVNKNTGYLHATFTSRIFRFVDDLELRMDKNNNVIHLRSASRTGYFDLGMNRKRAEQFSVQFMKLTGQ